jgi:hypothetical protein
MLAHTGHTLHGEHRPRKQGPRAGRGPASAGAGPGYGRADRYPARVPERHPRNCVAGTIARTTTPTASGAQVARWPAASRACGPATRSPAGRRGPGAARATAAGHTGPGPGPVRAEVPPARLQVVEREIPSWGTGDTPRGFSEYKSSLFTYPNRVPAKIKRLPESPILPCAIRRTNISLEASPEGNTRG